MQAGSEFQISAKVENTRDKTIARVTVTFFPASTDTISDEESGRVHEAVRHLRAGKSKKVRNHYTAQHPGTATVKVRVIEDGQVVAWKTFTPTVVKH